MKLPLTLALSASLLVPFAVAPAQAASENPIMKNLSDPQGGLVVVAHRGCHGPAPHHVLAAAPENSSLALQHCAAMGVDVMETDVRRTRDGYLVMMHDESVDRTTNGTGKIVNLTLAQIKNLRLRDDEGGPDAAVTELQVPTLGELLALAKGRIVLNIDVKDAIYSEVIDAVIKAGAQDWVIVKASVGEGSAPAVSLSPYDKVPFAVIATSADGAGADIPAIIARQAGKSLKPIAIELSFIPEAALPPIAKAAREARTRIWVNTLWNGFVVGVGGDRDALRMPAAVWGKLWSAGVSIMQTDEAEALIRFHDTLEKRATD